MVRRDTRARSEGTLRTDLRGQAFTLEAIASGLLLIASVLFALQVTAVTPLTGSTSSQHIENQQAEMADGLLASEAANGTLVPTLLYWNDSKGKFWGASKRGYQTGGPPTVFGETLNRSFRDRGIAFNVNLYYIRANGEREQIPLVHFGSPSDHASTASRTVTLYDDDPMRAADGSARGVTVSEATHFAPDSDPDGILYNVVDVEVVVWRM
jgi:hypothetical protein